jgi:hypothetical protein
MSEVEKKSGYLALLRLRKSLTQNKVELLCRHGRRAWHGLEGTALFGRRTAHRGDHHAVVSAGTVAACGAVPYRRTWA